MKFGAVLVCLLMAHGLQHLHAQPFQPLRYDEDYGYLQKDSARTTLKFIPVTKNRRSYLSVGGSFRTQYFHIINDSWGGFENRNYGYLLSRYLSHLDFHAGGRFRLFAEIQGGLAYSKPESSATDQNPLDLHQAFAEVTIRDSNALKLTLRLGRQELLYGSSRLISVREGPNTRQAFDVAKLLVKTARFQSDVFYAHDVQARKGTFDDRFSSNTKLWGWYNVLTKVPVLQNIDWYYLGIRRLHARFANAAGTEMRHSIGTRWWGGSAAFQYDLEAVFQTGRIGESTIRAWTASAHMNYRMTDLLGKPRLGLKTELISGDAHAADGSLGTFNPLFPRGAYFGLAALVGPANLIDIHPDISVMIHKNVSLGIDWDAFWRYSTHDGLYGPTGALVFPGHDISGRFIGNQYAASVSAEPGAHVSLGLECTWFVPGEYVKKVSPGRQIVFTGVTAQFKF